MEIKKNELIKKYIKLSSNVSQDNTVFMVCRQNVSYTGKMYAITSPKSEEQARLPKLPYSCRQTGLQNIQNRRNTFVDIWSLAVLATLSKK